jgi:hypothetical protein
MVQKKGASLMEMSDTGSAAVFCIHLQSHFLCFSFDFWQVKHFKCLHESLRGELPDWDRLRAHARSMDAVSPERLVTKERNLHTLPDPSRNHLTLRYFHIRNRTAAKGTHTIKLIPNDPIAILPVK